eukprot:Hpha_TRINITY_DN14961_c1_g5::TRINITY_DN14961_c1_g5_i1::g.143809::m.143809
MGTVEERVGRMLASTGGRDQVMALVQYVPGVLEPVARGVVGADFAEGMLALCNMCGHYRGVTRLQSTWLLVVGKINQLKKGGPEGTMVNKLLVHLKWLLDIGFATSEAAIIFTKAGIINRKDGDKRLAVLGPRCVWFFFMGLLVEQIRTWIQLLSLQKPDVETKKQRGQLLRHWLGVFLWFLVAWAGLPRDGTKAKLLDNPEGSPLLPLHRFVEMTTVPGLPVNPQLGSIMGLAASAMPVMGAWAASEAKS